MIDDRGCACPALVPVGWHLAAMPRRWTLVLGVRDADQRAALLRQGFGDAATPAASLHEIAARAERLATLAEVMPRQRQIARLRLDLAARDGFVGKHPLGLHPREFALLWHLAEAPGLAIQPDQLRQDIWNLHFRPETNSLAVHISRLRSKLRLAGIEGLIETCTGGAYRLVPTEASLADLPLDARHHLRKEQLNNDIPDRERQSGHAP